MKTTDEIHGSPRRRYSLILKIGADTRDDLVRELRHFMTRVAMDDITTGCIGGPTTGSNYELLKDPEQTHAAYFQQIADYRDRGERASS